ncbi:ABC transporter [Geobacillus subterraneus]|uniref:ABC transporter n=2 Tax=Geobacillus TaxID=129337 RepID=A0ABM6AFV8_9BACL|nr:MULTISPECIES: ABC transporter ATP-binding protein [Geobacillus]AMX85274.1 ABC transporter [Geobacillus subterraneus]KZS26929.1 ABC transporter [Geobacillus subterraneus]OXB88023.1 ABC transporter [Geobacillus uzenensis]WPZ20077.1 ABC transporter ATP-binding protein [Geobacillus subterraneus]
MIRVSHLHKSFRVHRREAGWLEAVRHLWRRDYRVIEAVKDVSFTIEKGEIVGFLGPNGAGKTTTMKMLAGLLHPTSGEITVGGFVPFEQKPEFKKMMSLVMGQKSQLIWDIPPMETFLVNKAIYDIDDRSFRQTLEELTELLDLAPLLDKPTRSLSLGQRMRCELAAALLHRPHVLFLDEPTIGLDVHTQENVRRFIVDYNREHETTILLTSHYMGDVAALCDRVMIINYGRLLYDGELSVLTEKLAPYKRLEVRFAQLPNINWDEYGEVAEMEEGTVVLRVARETAAGTAARLLQQFEVRDINIEDPPLEEVITRAFQGDGYGA